MDSETQPSPFHIGEQTLQKQAGVREQMEQFGRQVIRDHMPEQHRNFYQQQPFILAGHADADGNPWASLLYGEPGFIHSPDPHRLQINSPVIAGDPLAETLARQPDGVALGLLGIDLASRRRNRLSTVVGRSDQQGMELAVIQAFGNCPQYIQSRPLASPAACPPTPEIKPLQQLDHDAQALIRQADTFFIASSSHNNPLADVQDASQGVDISHRGGQPGFIHIEEHNGQDSLLIPDFAGNSHFNTLGNFLLNPRAGLLFIDFDQGHLLTLTGQAEILDQHPLLAHFNGAERLWRFTLSQGRWLKNALPLRWQAPDYSDNTLLTGSWAEAHARQKAAADQQRWQSFTVVEIEDESERIRSFYLQPQQAYRPQFRAGQFLTFRADIDGQRQQRNYSLSSAMDDAQLRISVKRDQHADGSPGIFSHYLHQQIRPGMKLQARGPAGEFTLQDDARGPLLLLAAGVGITPLLSMVRQLVNTAIAKRRLRPVTLIYSARNAAQRAFTTELAMLSAMAGSEIKVISVLSQPEPELLQGPDYQFQGHIDGPLLHSLGDLHDHQIYLCGPAGFMQHSYDQLRMLGVQDKQIFAESFGPAQLQRCYPNATANASSAPEIDQAQVSIDGTELAWQPGDGSLLELAEAHGFSPEFACRNGQCGSCKASLSQGQVYYPQPPSADVDEQEVLLCCARPASATLTIEL